MNSSTTTAQNQFNTGILFAIVGTALFSIKSIFIKLAFQEGIDAATLLALRMLIALPFYLIILWYAVKTRPQKAALLTKKNSLAIIVLGFLGYYLASYLDFQGLSYISAQLERLALFTYPVMVAILSWVFFRERITLRILTALVISYLGVSFLYLNESQSTSENIALGTSLVVAAAFSFSLYVIFSKNYIALLGSLIFTSIAMLSSTVFVFTQFFLTHPLSDLNVSTRLWVLSALLGIVSTLLPSFLTSEAIHRIGATKTSIMGSIGPVVTIVLAVNILGEDFGMTQMMGLLLVLLGVSFLKNK